MQKLIAGLSACQKSMEEVKALDDKVEKIMTSDHNGDSENSGIVITEKKEREQNPL